VVVTAAAYPLFLSASRDRLVETAVADPTITRYGAGITVTASGFRFAEKSPDGHGLLWQRRAELFDRAVAASPVLDDPLEQVKGQTVGVTGTDGQVPASGPVDGALFAGATSSTTCPSSKGPTARGCGSQTSSPIRWGWVRGTRSSSTTGPGP
jgi:hypothetical protein